MYFYGVLHDRRRPRTTCSPRKVYCGILLVSDNGALWTASLYPCYRKNLWTCFDSCRLRLIDAYKERWRMATHQWLFRFASAFSLPATFRFLHPLVALSSARDIRHVSKLAQYRAFYVSFATVPAQRPVLLWPQARGSPGLWAPCGNSVATPSPARCSHLCTISGWPPTPIARFY